MPQGPAHLHEEWGDDWVAWSYLEKRGFSHFKGVISPPVRRNALSRKETRALDYLCYEWDWSYVGMRWRYTEAPSSWREWRHYLGWLWLRLRDLLRLRGRLGVTLYDLEAGPKYLYPVLTPLRGSLPRLAEDKEDEGLL